MGVRAAENVTSEHASESLLCVCMILGGHGGGPGRCSAAAAWGPGGGGLHVARVCQLRP